MYLKSVLAAIVSMAAFSVCAQVQVIDRSPVPRAANSTSTGTGTAPPPVETGVNTAEIYYQMQLLQQEVQTLRGLVEEQAHELKRLKQQRLDDYIDLDRRVSQLSGTVSTSSTGAPSYSGSTNTSASTHSGSAAGQVVATADEAKLYRDAVNLLLKEKDYEQALTSLQSYLTQFPAGRYAANAYYWLGEIYLIKQMNSEAQQWFERLLAEFPNHSKADDAKFKLAKAYDLAGDKVKARPLLEAVAQGNSNAARLAASYLKRYYSAN